MNTQYTLSPTYQVDQSKTSRWGQLYGCALSLNIAEAALNHEGLSLVIAHDMHNALMLEQELRFFCPSNEIDVLLFPDWETLPYDLFSPHQDIISQRLSILYQLNTIRKGILIVSISTLMQRLAPRNYIEQNALILKTNDKLDLDVFKRQLTQSGYYSVSQVMEHGEYSIRGSLIDLFPAGSTQPFRIDLFDDEIETIRYFDPNTQRSTQTCQEIKLLPAREFPLTDEGIATFRSQYRDRFEGNPQNSVIYKEISEGRPIGGCEYYLPLFFDETCSLFSYLPSHCLIFADQPFMSAAQTYWQQIEERYEQRSYDTERPVLNPELLFIKPDNLKSQIHQHPLVLFQPFKQAELNDSKEAIHNFNTQALPPMAMEIHAETPSDRLLNYINNHKGRILFIAESAGRREVLNELLKNHNIQTKACENWSDWAEQAAPISISIAPISEGFQTHTSDADGLSIICESHIFGQRASQRRRREKSNQKNTEAIINNLSDLSIGSPVVHEENGVGRYLGLQKLDIGGLDREFLTLEYAEGDKLYVPVSSLNLISRYTGASPEHAPLHRLGSDHWQRTKKKAAKRITDIAVELLDVQAKREARQGYKTLINHQEINAFASLFPFEETVDQQDAIESVLNDLIQLKPMDRVVCGDVGFGKTEVAMRATFAVANDSRQVAILVPTTLLAQQHVQNFKDRFADWPFKIECLSRFSTRKEQDKALEGLKNGQIDIVIGTHKLIQKDIKFKNLGLIIVDEEHRFGVKHKEALKKLRAEVDILTLTATPIPRTLNMALSGLRDLSIIATPPKNRNAIKTFVNEWNDNLIIEACQREIKRGGQIYFVHNSIESIEKTAGTLNKLLPEANIAIAHGQLSERELESVMLDFYHQKHNILVCTTIIESGIDVPTANTIVINRADKFGLAQLHQLRGRVGRSHHNAYAYLITPPKNLITSDARKRLEAIESLEGLGAGFTLASHDLEIRGAGELLGEEQSGQIHEIGYSLYMEMLERVVKSLKDGSDPMLDKPLRCGTEINLGVTALLPDDYVYDVHERLVLYKRIANATDFDILRELQVELIDRFGLLPEPAKNLFTVSELKLRTQQPDLGINKIDANDAGGRIEFSDNPNIDVGALIKLVQHSPDKYIFDGKNKLRFHLNLDSLEKRVKLLETLLKTIQPNGSQ